MELALILLLVMFIFGVGRLPEIGQAVGKGIREFRQSQAEVEELSKSVEAEKLTKPVEAEKHDQTSAG
jgi:sec-independent protein translocase protein TatA